MKIGILGATGQAGQDIAQLLAQRDFAETVLIGRNRIKLEALRDRFAPTAEIRIADASNSTELHTAFADLDLAVIAVSSQKLLPGILQAAIETRTDCLDLLLCSAEKRTLLDAHADAFTAHGLTYITDGGFHPGVPAALARWAEVMCPELRDVAVFGSFGVDWSQRLIAPETMRDFVRELASMDTEILREGAAASGWRNIKKHDFSDGRGPKDCIPMGMDEMKELPRFIPTLRNAGFFVAGFGPAIDWGIMPLTIAMHKCLPFAEALTANFFAWGLRKFGGRDEWACLRLVGDGAHGHIEIAVDHSDAYRMTALPVVACLQQYAEGPRRPGLWRQALYVAPERFWRDLSSMGACIAINGARFPAS